MFLAAGGTLFVVPMRTGNLARAREGRIVKAHPELGCLLTVGRKPRCPLTNPVVAEGGAFRGIAALREAGGEIGPCAVGFPDSIQPEAVDRPHLFEYAMGHSQHRIELNWRHHRNGERMRRLRGRSTGGQGLFHDVLPL